jgi:DNA ligase (NAD+)
MDGSSLEIWYDDGIYTKAVTRGDGITGDDVTENVRKMNYVPKKLKEK